jgi:hypothetical protein
MHTWMDYTYDGILSREWNGVDHKYLVVIFKRLEDGALVSFGGVGPNTFTIYSGFIICYN